jgi:outer membrane lipoprotein-sorting protein
MLRFRALAFAAAPIALAAAVAPAPVAAQANNGLALVQGHLRAVTTMTANFSQTDQRGRTLSGTVYVKRPGRIRFDYGRNADMLVVGDGNALIFYDGAVNQTSRWPINDSPLSVLLNPNQDLSRFSRVTRNDNQVLVLEAHDPRRREFGTITIAFAKSGSAPGGLILTGWTVLDAQNRRTTVRLSGQRFNVPVADSLFRFVRPRRGGPRG